MRNKFGSFYNFLDAAKSYDSIRYSFPYVDFFGAGMRRHTYLHAHARARTHTPTHAYTHAYTYAYTHAYTYLTHIHPHRYTNAHKCPLL